MRIAWLLVVVSCKGAEKSEAPGSAGSAAIPTAVADAVVIDAPLPATCSDPCVYLVDQVMGDAAAKYEAECKTKWVLSSDESCDRYQYIINCIYAARGKVFVKPAWKDRFVGKPWYRPREDFKDSDLPALARHNIQFLRDEDKVCRAPKTLTAAEEDKVIATYEKLLNSELELPNMKHDEVESFFWNFATLTVGEETKVELESRTVSGFSAAISRLQHRAPSNAPPGYGSGYDDKLVIRLTFDAGKLVEVAWE